MSLQNTPCSCNDKKVVYLRRVQKHPILGDLKNKRIVHIRVDDQVIEAQEGEPIAAALLAA